MHPILYEVTFLRYKHHTINVMNTLRNNDKKNQSQIQNLFSSFFLINLGIMRYNTQLFLSDLVLIPI